MGPGVTGAITVKFIICAVGVVFRLLTINPLKNIVKLPKRNQPKTDSTKETVRFMIGKIKTFLVLRFENLVFEFIWLFYVGNHMSFLWEAWMSGWNGYRGNGRWRVRLTWQRGD